MKKTTVCLGLMLVLLLGWQTFLHAGKVELTTYYPAPFGEYTELKSNKLAVGTNAQTPATDGVMNFGGITGSNPGSGRDGDLYFNATDHVFRYYDGSGTGAWKDFGNAAPMPHDVLSSRSLGNDYKNSTGKTMFVSVSVLCGTNDNVIVYCDSSATPTTVIQKLGVAGAFIGCVFFIVPPEYSYRINQSGSQTKNYWYEWY